MRLLLAAFLLTACGGEETLPAGGECRDEADCFDGVVCNGSETCRRGFCVGGLAPSCDDHQWDTADRCDEDAGACVHEPYPDAG